MADVIIDQRTPVQIIAKNKSSQGIVKYKVKFSNGDEQWQNENHVRENYPHLLEDFSYYSITMTRYDPQMLEQKRLQYIQTSSFDPGNVETKIIKPLGKPPGKPANGSAKKSEKLKQKQNKVIEINESTENDKPQMEQEQIIVVPAPQQSTQQVRKEQVQITKQFEEEVIKTKMNSLLAKEVEQVRKSVKLRSSSDDKILKIQYIEQQELFKINWSQREDGTVPLVDYFDYESFKLNSPSLALQFLEQIYFKCKNDTDVKYEYVGDQSKANKKIRSLINPIEDQNYETFQQLMASNFLIQDIQRQETVTKPIVKKQHTDGTQNKPIEIVGEKEDRQQNQQVENTVIVEKQVEYPGQEMPQQPITEIPTTEHPITEHPITEYDQNQVQEQIQIQQAEGQKEGQEQEEAQEQEQGQQPERNQEQQNQQEEEQDGAHSQQNDENSQNEQNKEKEYMELPDDLFSQEEVRVPLNQDDC